MHLFAITPDNHPAVHVVARSHTQAVDVFVTFEAARERFHESLTIEAIPVSDLDPDQEGQVLDAMVLGIAGVLHLDEDLGWVFSAPLCSPQASVEPQGHGGEGDAR